jgi:divalent metal cation (Fe/Co/Zn/Cd) transporter
LLIALGHLLRILFGVAFVVYDIPVPMWASVIAVVITGYLAYQGCRLAWKATSIDGGDSGSPDAANEKTTEGSVGVGYFERVDSISARGESYSSAIAQATLGSRSDERVSSGPPRGCVPEPVPALLDYGDDRLRIHTALPGSGEERRGGG